MKGHAKLALPEMFTMLIGFGIVFLSILYSVMQISNNEAYKEELYIVQLGLELQAIQATDVNLQRYITDAGAYNLIFQGGEVSIKKGKKFYFTKNPDNIFMGGEYSPQLKTKTIGPLTIFKTGKYIGVKKPDEVPSPYLTICEELQTTAKKININSTEETKKIANMLKSGNTKYTTNDDNADISIKIQKGPNKIFYKPEKQSKKLACEIQNQLAKELNISINIIPINIEHLLQTDEKNILKKPGIIIQIDNFENKENNAATAINKGAINYGLI